MSNPEQRDIERFESGLSEALGIPKSFFRSLSNDDDWAFVIKIHALVEGALNHMLCDKLGDHRLHKFVSRIETSNTQVGKLALVNALELLPKHLQTFTVALSTVRNAFVHDVKNINTTLPAFMASLEGGKRRMFRAGLMGVVSASMVLRTSADREHHFTPSQFLDFSPRMTIIFGAADIVSTALTGGPLNAIATGPFPEFASLPQSTPTV